MHRAPVYGRLTRSTEVCIEQPFTQVMLAAPKYARSSRFFCRAVSIEEGSDEPFTH